MPRVKRGSKRVQRRKKILTLAKGYRLTKSKLHRSAKESVDRALRFAYRDRALNTLSIAVAVCGIVDPYPSRWSHFCHKHFESALSCASHFEDKAHQ